MRRLGLKSKREFFHEAKYVGFLPKSLDLGEFCVHALFEG